VAFFALLSNHLIRTPCALLFFFLAVCLVVADGQVTSPEIEKLIQLGRAEVDKGDFAKALGYFNRAMGFLKQASPKHPWNEVVRKEIRIAKGRSLVARYQKRSGLKIIQRDELLPLGDEPDEILVSQRFGTVLAREVWQPKEIKGIGEFIGIGRRLTVLPEAGVELYFGDASKFSLRSVDAASFALPENNIFDLHSGSFVISSNGNDNSTTIKSPLSTIRASCDSPFALMIGITTNGGLKIIALLGECKLEQEKLTSSVLSPGELVFALPEGFSRKMSVELSTLMVTSKLMTGFDDPPVYLKKLRQQAMIQALRTRKRYKAVVGDAKNSKDFEIKVLKPEQP
jgi:hypothetical protein